MEFVDWLQLHEVFVPGSNDIRRSVIEFAEKAWDAADMRRLKCVQVAARMDRDFYANMDAGIAPFVKALVDNGIETYESCEGSDGHAFRDPTILFHGGPGEGYRAFGVARQLSLPVAEIQRRWRCEDGDLVGPSWAMVFWRAANEDEIRGAGLLAADTEVR